MDRQLSAAILVTFRDVDPAKHGNTLRAFTLKRWAGNFRWLDASGLALYFLERLLELQLLDCVPGPILSALQQRRADNIHRTSHLFEECARINEGFGEAGVQYVHLKGFGLVPDYCPDLSLRYQLDFDFLIDPCDSATCCEVLNSLGYQVVAANPHVIELKTGGGRTPRISDLYKATSNHAVELHLCDATRSDRHPRLLERRQLLTERNGEYPVLSREDMFLSQASHVFRHLRSEWTRISWLWELRHCVTRHYNDDSFWQAVRLRTMNDNQGALAIGTSLQVAQKAFGNFVNEGLDRWAIETLPESVADWIERHGDNVVLSDFPGSKLYLLLEQALSDECKAGFKVRTRLLPRHAPAKFAPRPDSLVQRLLALLGRCSYFLHRLRFHIVAGSEYLVESRRCKHLDRRERRQSADAFRVSRQTEP